MADLSGVSLGSYRILEPIGRGGMSVVYKAYHAGTDRLVALKILPEGLAQDPLLLERFRQEARVVARLEHRHIVPIYDFGEFAGVVYLAMRYLQAGTVKDILARSHLSLPDALPLIVQVANALDYAHEQGIVHRDVKPGNILIDKHGDAYLTDFGLAKLLEAPGELTHSGSLVGTPAYMAPEQTLGQPLSPATDVYALGVMIYEIATGRLPFVSDTPMAIALMHLHATLPMPRTVNPALSDAVEQIILKALDKEPGRRFPTAGELARALADAVEGETEGATPPAPAQLVQIAGEIAGQKAPEEGTGGLRTEIHHQVAAEQRRRLLRWAPWVGAGVLLVGLALALLLTISQAAQARVSAGQTATAVIVLLDQLGRAETAVASGGAAKLPTVEYLQTQVAAALTAGATVALLAPSTSIPTQSPTATATATPSTSRTATSTPTQSLSPIVTSTPLLFVATNLPPSPADTATDTLAPPSDTVPPPTDTLPPPTDTLQPATDTPPPPTDTLVPSDTPTQAVITDTPTGTPPPPSATPTFVTPARTSADTPPPQADAPTQAVITDTPTDTPLPTETTTASGF